MNTILFTVIACLLVASQVSAAGVCRALISANPRSGSSWSQGGVAYQLYDISVSNTGTCDINSLFGLFAVPTPGSISQAWNYQQTTGEITGYGGRLTPSQVFTGAGFIVAGGVAPTLAFNTPSCPASCTGETTGAASSTTAKVSTTTGAAASSTTAKSTTGGAPTTTAKSTTGSTTGASSTTGAASCDTIQCFPPQNTTCINTPNGPVCYFRSCSDVTCLPNQVCINDGGYARCINTSSNATCSIRSTVSARPNSSFLVNGVPSQIYDLDIFNSGNTAVKSVSITITPRAGTSVIEDNKWNLNKLPGNFSYAVMTYGDLAPNAHFYGAGFVLTGTNSSTLTPAVATLTAQC